MHSFFFDALLVIFRVALLNSGSILIQTCTFWIVLTNVRYLCIRPVHRQVNVYACIS